MRVKNAVYTRQKKKKWFRQAKGAYATKKNRWRMVIQHLEKSWRYMYRGRKEKKRAFRSLWIQRLNAAARQNGLSYSVFMNGLRKAGVTIDRKILAEMAIRDSASFQKLVGISKEFAGRSAAHPPQ
ncbi:MAG TPA: 50S ribosomal protein L20 [Elusimicrobiota bacterium]|nr:50S ribosomal protein L20 [Elusimicrobiota bacterium]